LSEVKIFKSNYCYGQQPSEKRKDLIDQINKYAKENNLEIKSCTYEQVEEYSRPEILATVIFEESEQTEQQNLVIKLLQRIDAMEAQISDLKSKLSEKNLEVESLKPRQSMSTMEIEFGNDFLAGLDS
jgi:hypothetical protein